MENSRNTRAGIWQADMVSVAALIVFVVVVWALDRFINPQFNTFTLVVTGIVLALVPAVIWLAFFYRRDRLEPEPKAMVLQVFVLGGLLAAAIGIPLVNDVFDVSSWLTRSTLSHLFGSILVIGFTQEFLKYAAVRFSVFGSEEFDECVDGIVYATAAGLGYALVLNIHFVVASGGVDLGVGVMRITITSLAHASFAGVVGYFLGMEKFGNRPAWWTAAGVSLAALLNGVFFYLRSTITSTGITASGGQVQRWIGFALAAALAAVVTWLLSRAISRQMTPAAPAAAEEA